MQATIVQNDRIAPGYYRMGLECPAPDVEPGQFVMLRVTESLDPLLRRPFGVYDIRTREGRRVGLDIVYRVVGRGTAIMAEKRPGEKADVLCPLGRGFPPPEDPEKTVLVAGGMGIVPLYLLAKALGTGRLFFGARTSAEAVLARDFEALGFEVRTATEDGSLGTRGLVTDLLELAPDSVVYACGPPKMLKAVAAMAAGEGSRCFVSLERHMACGIGVCLGCAVKARGDEKKADNLYRMVCSEGPVFDADLIDWEEFC